MVTPEPPVKAVKKPHSNTRTIGVPPGIQPNDARNNRTRRSEARLSARIYHANVKRGMVDNVGETTMRYASAGIAANGV